MVENGFFSKLDVFFYTLVTMDYFEPHLGLKLEFVPETTIKSGKSTKKTSNKVFTFFLAKLCEYVYIYPFIWSY